MASEGKELYEDFEIEQRNEDTLNNSVERRKHDLNMQVPPLAKPLRILQFIILLALFSFIVYMTALNFKSNEPVPVMRIIFSILYLVLTTVFVFVIALDIISQFDGSGLTDTPMVGFSFVGFIIFAMTSIIMVFYIIKDDSRWVIMMLFTLCVISTILFLIDLLLCFSFWREKYMRRKKCYPYFRGEHEHPSTGILYLSKHVNKKQLKECKCDLSTSISNVMQPVMIDEPNNEHVYRKIGIGRRREYADFSDNTPLTMLEAVQVQTEPKKILVAESQTHRRELKEIPVQTLNQAEQNNFRIEQPSCTYPTTSMCPAFIQLMRGGMATQCFAICKCGEGTMIHEQQQQHLQLQLLQSTNETPSEGFITNETREPDQATCVGPTFEIDMSSKSTNLPEIVTNVTLSSYRIRNNKIHSLSETREKEFEMNEKEAMDNEKRELEQVQEDKNDHSDGERELETIQEKKVNNSKRVLKDTNNEKFAGDSKNKKEMENIPDKTVDYETKIIPDVRKKNIPDGDQESFDKKGLLNDENFALSQKIIQMSQEAINRAEKTLSAPGSYNKPCTILEVPEQICPKLGSSAPKLGLFHKKNRVEPLDFKKCNKSSLPFLRETVLKLRLPLENCATETRIISTNEQESDRENIKETSVRTSTNQNKNEFPESKKACTCITRSKRTHKLCTVQVQYIFQDPKGRIVCKSCSTPESIRIPQKITCSAQRCLTCYICNKVLSPPCECSSCCKQNNSM